MASIIFAAIQAGSVVWPVVITTAVLSGIAYYVKNYLAPSGSGEGVLNWKDILSGLILAVVAGMSDSITQWITNDVIDWSLAAKTAGSLIVTYFVTTFFSGHKLGIVDPPPPPPPPSK